jgi:hypothetical protein
MSYSVATDMLKFVHWSFRMHNSGWNQGQWLSDHQAIKNKVNAFVSDEKNHFSIYCECINRILKWLPRLMAEDMPQTLKERLVLLEKVIGFVKRNHRCEKFLIIATQQHPDTGCMVRENAGRVASLIGKSLSQTP